MGRSLAMSGSGRDGSNILPNSINTHTLTWQLSSPAAHTVGEVLHTMVSLTPVVEVLSLALPLTAAYAAWHADAVVQTLQPTPVHPSVHEQPEEVKLGKPPEATEDGARERWEPSNMVPPHAG